MSKVLEYTIVFGSDDVVSANVSKLLRDGWKLHGDLKFQYNGMETADNRSQRFAQALVKELDLRGEWG